MTVQSTLSFILKRRAKCGKNTKLASCGHVQTVEINLVSMTNVPSAKERSKRGSYVVAFRVDYVYYFVIEPVHS